MGIYLNPGNGSFKIAVNSEIYVDKTELIKETNKVINTEQRFVCISRPRRFGKSMAANMLIAYYDKNCDSAEMFASYKISECECYKKHLNQYNVIALNMQEFLSIKSTVNEMVQYLQKKVIKELRKNYPEIIDEDEQVLSIALKEIYSDAREQFIFVIDEWDCVLREKKFTQEDYTMYLDFLRNLLKDQTYVALAYMTGILPIKKYGSHSALNMFYEYSMTDPGQYVKYIGFSEEEVSNLCQQYQADFEKIKEWYNGYTFFEDLHIYNPRSVVESILRKNVANYWTQTETYEALRVYLSMNFDGLRDSVIQMLAGEAVKVTTRTFQNDMTTFESKDDVLTLLIHLGYLAFDMHSQAVFIPNTEIQDEFKNAIERCDWKEVTKLLKQSDKLLEATLDMDNSVVEKYINQAHNENTSILTYNDENSLSCVISLAYYSAIKYYNKVRELPTGKGFADIVFIPKRHCDKPALIIELKFDKTAQGAIAQIKDKKYVEALKEYQGNILLVGINYDKTTKEHQCVIEKHACE